MALMTLRFAAPSFRCRSCNSWSFCEHDDPEGNPNWCGGKCHLSFIPNPTANKGADGKYSKPPAAIKVQGTQLEVPWVTGVLDKAVLPKTGAKVKKTYGPMHACLLNEERPAAVHPQNATSAMPRLDDSPNGTRLAT